MYVISPWYFWVFILRCGRVWRWQLPFSATSALRDRAMQTSRLCSPPVKCSSQERWFTEHPSAKWPLLGMKGRGLGGDHFPDGRYHQGSKILEELMVLRKPRKVSTGQNLGRGRGCILLPGESWGRWEARRLRLQERARLCLHAAELQWQCLKSSPQLRKRTERED